MSLVSKLSAVTQFELPLVPNNIPFACHPDFELVCKKVDEWLLCKLEIKEESARKKIIASRMGMYACMMHPYAERDRVVLAGRHLWALFLLDDVLESSSDDHISGLNEIVLKIANGTYEGAHGVPALDLYGEVMGELRAAMEPGILDRYLNIFANFLDAVRHQVNARNSDKVLEENEYRLARRETGFMEVAACIMTEFCMGIRLEQADLQSPTYRKLVDHVSDHMMLVNDLLSFRKELYEGHSHHNWISVLLHHCPKVNSLQDAIDEICDMLRAEEFSILTIQKSVVEKDPRSESELAKLVRYCPMAVSGHMRWSFISGRYHGFDNTLLTGEIFSGTWLLHPKATIVLPPRIKTDHPYVRRGN